MKRFKNWGLGESYGKCEICNKTAGCCDIPSKYLELKEENKTKKEVM